MSGNFGCGGSLMLVSQSFTYNWYNFGDLRILWLFVVQDHISTQVNSLFIFPYYLPAADSHNIISYTFYAWFFGSSIYKDS